MAEALTALANFSWPGNVRQLENAVYRAVVISERSELALSDFPLLASHDASLVADLPRLVADLGSDSFKARDRASAGLEKLGDLAKIEKNPSMEGKRMTAMLAPK